MKTHSERTVQSSRAALRGENDSSPQTAGATLQFTDRRPEAGSQRTLTALAGQGPQIERAMQFQSLATEHAATRSSPSALPAGLRSGIERLSGYAMDDVRVHYDSPQPAQLRAHAFAQGSDIHLAPGQERHLPHEAWHVVQQKQGRVRPTLQLKGNVPVNDDRGLEREADVMGSRALTTSPRTDAATEIRRPNSSVVQRIREDEALVKRTNDLLNSIRIPARSGVSSVLGDAKPIRAYLYEGLGGGGAGKTRSDEVKSFRGALKTAARTLVSREFDTIQSEEERSGSLSATSDYQLLLARDQAHADIKGDVDQELLAVTDDILGIIKIYELVYQGLIKGHSEQTIKAQVIDRVRYAKDRIVGKVRREREQDPNTLTRPGQEIIDRVVGKVSEVGVGRRVLEQVISAPTVGAAMQFLAGALDAIIPHPGESAELKIKISIPTPVAGLSVIIKLDGLAARGTDGATTAGMAQLGNANRVEISATFSLGAGAEAIGLKSSGSLGVFVRSGSDEGSEAALQALSYGAYRAFPEKVAKKLWAPSLKGVGMSKIQLAEMWAAMIEEQYFQGKGGTFADIGATIDGDFGVKFSEVLKAEFAINEKIFTHFDEKVLKKVLQDRFAGRVLSKDQAKLRSKQGKGEKKLALGGSAKVDITLGDFDFSVGLAVSGSDFKNIGGTLTIGFPSEGDQQNITTRIQQIVEYAGVFAKKVSALIDSADRGEDRKAAANGLGFGIHSLLTIMDLSSINTSITKAATEITPADPGVHFDTPVGTKMAPDAVSKAKKYLTKSAVEIMLSLGRNEGRWIGRVEIVMSRGLDLGFIPKTEISAKKALRVYAREYQFPEDGSIRGGEHHQEILGIRTS